MNTPEIRVSLTDTRPIDCLDDGEPYCAIVMDWDDDNKTWYNTGIVCWAQSPTEAYTRAYKRYLE